MGRVLPDLDLFGPFYRQRWLREYSSQGFLLRQDCVPQLAEAASCNGIMIGQHVVGRESAANCTPQNPYQPRQSPIAAYKSPQISASLSTGAVCLSAASEVSGRAIVSIGDYLLNQTYSFFRLTAMEGSIGHAVPVRSGALFRAFQGSQATS